MKISSLPLVQPRWRAGDSPERRTFRCSRCGKQWSSTASWLAPVLQCTECQTKQVGVAEPSKRREWLA